VVSVIVSSVRPGVCRHQQSQPRNMAWKMICVQPARLVGSGWAWTWGLGGLRASSMAGGMAGRCPYATCR